MSRYLIIVFVFLILLILQNLRLKRVKTLLKVSEKRYRSLFDNMLDGMAQVRVIFQDGKAVDFEYLEVNAAHGVLTGYSNLVGKKISDVLPGIGKTNPDVFESVGRVATSGKPEKFDIYLHPVSSWFSASVYSVETGDVVIVFDNITSRKQAEEDLYLFKDLLDHSIDAVGVATPQGRHFYQNKAFDDFFGDVGEHPDQTTFVDKEEGRRVFDTIRGGGRFQGEVQMYNKEGLVRDVLLRAFAIFNREGQIAGIAGIKNDITEARKKEAELKFQNTLLSTQQETSIDGILVVGVNGRVLSFNRRFAEIWRAPDNVLAKGLDEDLLDHVLSQVKNPEGFLKKIRALYADKSWTGHDEIHLVDGRVLERYSAPIRDSEDEYYGRVWYFHDLTPRKKAEEEKIKLYEQLHQSRKMESVGRLAGGVAHDFNNMLGVILGHLDIIMEDMDDSDPVYEDLKEIQKAGKRSADLTRQLLAFARKQTSSPVILDVNETVGGMHKMLKRLIGEDIDLVWTPGKNLKPVKIDPSQVDQLMVNLCLNARQAIDGVGKISIRTTGLVLGEKDKGVLQECEPGDYILLEVSDTGCGMDKETCDLIFEPFYSTRDMGQGTGLGLATVYGLVKQNGGMITVSSEPGKGTVFRIYFPASQAPLPMPVKTTGQAKPGGGDETILLVEDEPIILEMAARMLEKSGYRVLASKRPEDAVQLAGEFGRDIHLLITDVIMPGMDGRELSATIAGLYPDIHCLFMSGYTADIIGRHGVLDDGVHFIPKPFSLAGLREKVREIFDRA